MDKKWQRRRKRLFEILEVGSDFDKASRTYDFINAFAIIINLVASIMYTYEQMREQYGEILIAIEQVTVAFFAVDYILRLFTAKFLYPDTKEPRAICRYMTSFSGIIDLLSFLPYYLPFFFPTGTVAFRMIRVVRIFRLFKINAYHDSLSIIMEVLRGRKQQLISSVFIILVLMLASSLCMYSVEHEAQPDVFTNAFSGIWWAASTLLTVGYGDIYPVTTLGKWIGIVIAFLGVGMVAIPTGIISAGFVSQYSNIKRRLERGYDAAVHFIKIIVKENDKWANKRVAELMLPSGVILAVIKRKDDVIVPRGDVVILPGDNIVLGAEPFDDYDTIDLKEMVLKEENPWNGQRIADLDISRHTVIVLVKRKNKALIPNGNMVLRAGDRVFVYTQKHLKNVTEIEI